MTLGSRVAGAFLATVALLLPTSATAAWAPARPMDPVGWWSADNHDLATSARGGSALLWTTMAPGSTTWVVKFRRIAEDGTLGAVRTLPGDMANPRHVSLALDEDGDALIAWSRSHEVNGLSGGRVFARRLSRTGVLGPAIALGPATALSDHPTAALSPSGVGAVVYDEVFPDNRRRQALRRLPFSGGTSAPKYLPPAGSLGTRLVATRQGDFVTASTRADGELVATRWRADGSIVHRVASADTPLHAMVADLGFDTAGTAHLTWYANQDGARPVVWSRTWSSTGVLGAARRISPTTHTPLRVSAATDLEGDTMLAWSVSRGTARPVLHTRILRRDGTLGPVHEAGNIKGPESGVRPAPAPELAVDSNGDGVLAWPSEPEPEHDVTWVRKVSQQGVLAPLVRLADQAEPFDAVMTPTGRARLTVVRDQRLWLYTGP